MDLTAGIWPCRVRLQWSQADWPDTGAPDTAGGWLGAHVAARLEPVTLLQVGEQLASQLGCHPAGMEACCCSRPCRYCIEPLADMPTCSKGCVSCCQKQMCLQAAHGGATAHAHSEWDHRLSCSQAVRALSVVTPNRGVEGRVLSHQGTCWLLPVLCC